MIYLSVCSGMEGASLAWEPLGWKPLAYSEIDTTARELLQQRYPLVPLYGDFTTLRDMRWIVDADVLVGGTPCQGFSVAGLRGSLADDRSNLCLEFIRLANAIDDLRRAAGKPPTFVLWENVPGVFSTPDNAFGSFLGGLVGSDAPIVPRGGWQDAGVADGPRRCAAWRVMDAQYFGLAQRRQRVFVLAVEHPRGWAAPDALLPIVESVRWHPAPRREAGKGTAADVVPSLTGSGRGVGRPGESRGQDPVVAMSLNARGGSGRSDAESETFIAHTLRADGFDATEDGTGRGTPLVVDTCPTLQARGNNTGGDRPPGTDVDTVESLIAFSCKDHGADAGLVAPTLRAMDYDGSHANAGGQIAVAFAEIADPVAANQGRTYTREGSHNFRMSNVALAFESRFARNGRGAPEEVVPPLKAQSGSTGTGDGSPLVATPWAVRRLTPRECERLQGAPDDWTAIKRNGKQLADGPRYKMLGNSFAVPVVRWIGERIEAVR